MPAASALRMAQRTTLIFLALIVTGFAMPGAAQASTYRFWNFWTASESSWIYSQLGPASTFPEDGSVQGWVFAATDADSESVMPGIDPDLAFSEACANTTAAEGQKRVALVIDSGSIEIAPESQTPPKLLLVCAVGSSEASGYELLNAFSELRTENGFICAINTYPAMECSAAFDTNVATAPSNAAQVAPTKQETGNSAAPLGTALVIGLIAVAGFYFWRKRSS